VATLFLTVVAWAIVPSPTPSPPAPVEAATQNASATHLKSWQSRFERRAFGARSGIILPYRLARPLAAGPHPLVLVLHGSGAIGSDNESQLGPFAASWAQLLDDSRDSPIVLVPQVPSRSADYIFCRGKPCASRPGPSFEALLELLDSFVTSNTVDRQRIYVVGFSMGGSAALQLALAQPKFFAGMVAFAPVPPSSERAAELKRLRLLVVHGNRDTENPFNLMRGWVGELQKAGGRAIFSVREGMGHQVPEDMLVDPDWRRQLLRNHQ